MVHYLPLLHQRFINKDVGPLIHDGDEEAGGGSRYYGVHHDLVGAHVVVGNFHAGACIHKERCYQDDECTCYQEAYIACKESSITVLLVHSEN